MWIILIMRIDIGIRKRVSGWEWPSGLDLRSRWLERCRESVSRYEWEYVDWWGHGGNVEGVGVDVIYCSVEAGIV